MTIKGCTSIKEYKEIRNSWVKSWFLCNFEPGFCHYEIIGCRVKVIDFTGDVMWFNLAEI